MTEGCFFRGPHDLCETCRPSALRTRRGEENMAYGNSIIASLQDAQLGVSPRCTGVARKTKNSVKSCPPAPDFPYGTLGLLLSTCPSSLVLEFHKELRTTRARCSGPIILLGLEELPGPKASEGAYHEGGVQGSAPTNPGRR